MVASDIDATGGQLFAHGRDNEFAGLQTPANLSEAPERPTREGRVIRVNDVLNDVTPDVNETFDADLGQSSEED